MADKLAFAVEMALRERNDGKSAKTVLLLSELGSRKGHRVSAFPLRAAVCVIAGRIE